LSRCWLTVFLAGIITSHAPFTVAVWTMGSLLIHSIVSPTLAVMVAGANTKADELARTNGVHPGDDREDELIINHILVSPRQSSRADSALCNRRGQLAGVAKC
jgi:hypothetical protein